MSQTHANLIIGLAGSLGSGCTTLSEALADKGFKRISIAGLIKDRFRKLHPGREPTLANYGSDWRAELQDIGNRGRKGEFAEQADTEVDHGAYWVDLALSCVDPKHDEIGPPYLCDGKIDGEQPCRCNFRRKFFPSRGIELCTAIHAEERAILSLAGRSADGCTIYVNTFPCFQCARQIINVGIKKVVYVEAYPIEEAVELLNTNGVEIKPFEGFTPRIFNQVFRQVE